VLLWRFCRIFHCAGHEVGALILCEFKFRNFEVVDGNSSQTSSAFPHQDTASGETPLAESVKKSMNVFVKGKERASFLL